MKPNIDMTSRTPVHEFEGMKLQARIYMKITVTAKFSARPGHDPNYKRTRSFGGYTPMECVEAALQHARDYIEKYGRKNGPDQQVSIYEPPTVTRITADNELPALIILRIQ